MASTEFKSAAKINSEFVVNNPISDPNVINALYTDPFYGLNNENNYM
jgi:hypothetical protein